MNSFFFFSSKLIVNVIITIIIVVVVVVVKDYMQSTIKQVFSVQETMSHPSSLGVTHKCHIPSAAPLSL